MYAGVEMSHTQKVDPVPKYLTTQTKKGMPVFVCDCGATILIVPDIPAMVKAIRNHLKEHNSDPAFTEDKLTKEILKALFRSLNENKTARDKR
jgi:hypothetical protein